MTLVELLTGMAISLLVLGGALTTFDGFNRNQRDNDARNQTTEEARTALDTQARQLRNLAKRVSSPVIDTLSPYDLIFQTSDPARTWVRYCLNTSTSPASTERGRVWTSELAVASSATASPVTSAMRASCPGSGWTTTQVVADYVTNRRTGTARPMFQYSCTVGTTCTASQATYDQIVNITAQLVVDTTPGYGPTELPVISSVFLRNQNQAPVASFVWTRSSTSRTVILNAAGSTDYEGRTLDYYWFKTAMPLAASIDCAHPTVTGTGTPRTLWGATGFIGDGVTLTHTFPGTDGPAGTIRNIGLVACDPGDRYDVLGMAPKALVGRGDPDMRQRLASDEGSVLVIAISLLAIMLTIGLASYALSDTGQKRVARAARARGRAEPRGGRALQPGLRARVELARQQRRRRRDADVVHVGGDRDVLPGPAHARLRQRGRLAGGELHERRRRGEHDVDDAHPRQRRDDRRRVHLRAGRRGADRHGRADRRAVHVPRLRATGTPTGTSCCGSRRARSCAGGRATSSRCCAASSSPRRSAAATP